MITTEAAIAATRFGFGESLQQLSTINASPREWLLSQVTTGRHKMPDELADIPSSSQLIRKTFELRKQQKEAQKDPKKRKQPAGKALRELYMTQAAARTKAAIHSEHPFRERLVQFWSNHFAVSIDKIQLLGIAGCYENEAIRPHITGSFRELLQAANQHPAMLFYLDNWQSIGPNSRAGKRRNKGINENLAREILELHTLGVKGGYQQADVIALAKALTGWTVGNRRMKRSGREGEFSFLALTHEPGSVEVMNKRYRQSSVSQGEAILDDLARHPSTARHIATKLCRHFLADVPNEKDISTLERTFLETDGDLPSLYQALIDLDEAWSPTQQKFKTPNDLVISTYRSLQLPTTNDRFLLGAITELGQPPYKPGSPAGWPDRSSAWDGGSMLMKRIEWIHALAEKAGRQVDPATLANDMLGPLLADHTLTAIRRAESSSQGLALLLLSPEFQRR